MFVALLYAFYKQLQSIASLLIMNFKYFVLNIILILY